MREVAEELLSRSLARGAEGVFEPGGTYLLQEFFCTGEQVTRRYFLDEFQIIIVLAFHHIEDFCFRIYAVF